MKAGDFSGWHNCSDGSWLTRYSKLSRSCDEQINALGPLEWATFNTAIAENIRALLVWETQLPTPHLDLGNLAPVHGSALCIIGRINRNTLWKSLNTEHIDCNRYYNCVAGNSATLGLYEKSNSEHFVRNLFITTVNFIKAHAKHRILVFCR